jgi:hypothetical protein
MRTRDVDEALEAAWDLLLGADQDLESRCAREDLCRRVGGGLATVGRALWVGGKVLERARRLGSLSPDLSARPIDATAGLGVIVQEAGELVRGTVLLLEGNNTYAAAALTRQLLEAEYLLWAFAEDIDEADQWLRSGIDDWRMWQPARLRERSKGLFATRDYRMHCSTGGHPSPNGMELLPAHKQLPISFWWLDLANHCSSVWQYLLVALERAANADYIRRLGVLGDVDEALTKWASVDKLRGQFPYPH